MSSGLKEPSSRGERFRPRHGGSRGRYGHSRRPRGNAPSQCCYETVSCRYNSARTHLPGSDECARPSIPAGDEEAKRVAEAEGYACQERPLFALDPVVVPDVVCIREDGVEAEEGRRVEVVFPGQRYVEGRAHYFGRFDLDRAPATSVRAVYSRKEFP